MRAQLLSSPLALCGAWLALTLAGCAVDGVDGQDGADGADGVNGQDGDDGVNGQDGDDGKDGADGQDGLDGADGEDLYAEIGPEVPRSAMVAVSFVDGYDTEASDLVGLVKARAEQLATGTLPGGVQFPLHAASTDTVRAIAGLQANVVVRWLDPLSYDAEGVTPRFGANNDYIAFFGDGWDEVSGDAPQWNGDGWAGWAWVNHEYISGDPPTLTSAATGQYLTLARYARFHGLISGDPDAEVWSQEDLDALVRLAKTQVGGSWLRLVQDPATRTWALDLAADNLRYDATSGTLLTLTGQSMSRPDHDDDGATLPDGVITGLYGDCSGGQTPWGTIFTAEENVQFAYGDLEACWDSNQKFLTGFGFDPGATITFERAASDDSEYGVSSDLNAHHDRDLYGFLAEMDPGVAPDEYEGKTTAGVGHKKLGAMGRARWENAAFAVDEDWRLVSGEPIVVYAGDDRRSGRIFKFVSSKPYTAGMTDAQIRALLDAGKVYVSHFEGLDHTTGLTLVDTGAAPTEANPGVGRWIELSLTSRDFAPNASALGEPTKTVGQALADVDWNGVGGFASDDDVRRALFTACNKLGVSELNRPEDLEWNPLDPSGTPRLYVAFTNHGRQVANDQDGVMYDPSTFDSTSPKRPDRDGAIFALEESDPSSPSTSDEFFYFTVWSGGKGAEHTSASNPDNLLIDAEGGLWFGTDGNYGRNGHADALYYLDLDPSHAAGMPGVVEPTYGVALRVIAGPSDSEATGPALTPDQGTLFFAVQHPGEEVISLWPSSQR